VLVSLVCRAGQWSVRLRTYRLGLRGGRQQWLPTNQLILLPLHTVPTLQALLRQTTARAVAHVATPRVPGGHRS
jgi:hypothetical protein